MSPPGALIVVGGGEHGRVVLEAALSRPDLWNVLGFVDPKPCADTTRLTGVPRLGSDEEGLDRAQASDLSLILGLGSTRASQARVCVVKTYESVPAVWASVVHARAWVQSSVSIGSGVFVAAGALVNSGAKLGDHSVINTGAIVEHDVVLGAFALVAPGAVVGGGVTIGEGSHLGLGCRVRDHVVIGRGVTVGMGAVVVSDVNDGHTVIGIPARTVT